MNWLDVVLIVAIALSAIVGYRMGLVQSAAGLVGILVGITIASRLDDKAASIFSSATDNENAQTVAGFLLVFVLVIAAAMVLSTIVNKMLRVIMLGWVNQLGGLALGAVVAMAIASAALANVQEFPVLDLEETTDESAIGTFLADNFDVVLRGIRIMPKGYGVLDEIPVEQLEQLNQ